MSFSIKRLSAPSFRALDDTEIAEWLRIDVDDDQSTVSMLISAATEVVEGLTNLAIGQADYQITYDISACSYRLPFDPIQSVTSVEYLDEEGASQSLAYAFRNGVLTLTSGLPPFPPIIRLTAGYDAVAAIPDALRWAISLLVSAGYNGREDIDPKVMDAVERLCSRYRRIVL